MNALAVLGALLIGISLGLLGSGGSILTVPVLVYLLDQPEKIAIAGSLAIVGAIALAGAIPWALSKHVHWRSVLWFGVPGILGTVGGAAMSAFVTGEVQLIVFAGVMLIASWFMWGQNKVPDSVLDPVLCSDPFIRSRTKLAADGIAVGALTGFVGVGGGFMIVPALVLLGRLDMHRAVGTSLVIIALKSFAGFAQYLVVLDTLGLAVDWQVIGVFTAIGIAGSVVGNRIGRRVPQATLKRGFGALLIPMALYILWRSWP
ncbi:MAG: sulfite exporter TauE/SafE family protein [Gammaproteobacteria bacterium]